VCLCFEYNKAERQRGVAAGALFYMYMHMYAGHKRDGARLVLCAPNWAKIINTCKRCVYVCAREHAAAALILVHSVVHSALFVSDQQLATRALIKFICIEPISRVEFAKLKSTFAAGIEINLNWIISYK